MVRVVWIAFLVLAAGTVTMLAAQERKSDAPTSEWTYPVIQGYGRAWPLPHAAGQPQKGRTYKILFNLSQPSRDPSEPMPGLEHAARTLNVFASLGVPPENLKVVAVFHGPVASYAAMDNDIYRAKFNVDNPNAKLIHELKAAGVNLLLCGQALHELNFNEKDMLPDVKLASSAMLVLAIYQNDGYAMMPF